MKSTFVSEIRQLVNGELIKGSDDLLITDASYYIKQMKRPNTVLFLSSKWKVDYNVIRKCVPCAVITQEVYKDLEGIDDCSIILVENLEDAYWKFVEYYRNLFDIPVFAVTGTNGKTTTKDMIKHILSHNHKIQGTYKSSNGNPGHLIYLLKIDETIEAAVFETGVSRPGDLIFSCKHFKPTIGIITNIGVDHLNYCKTLEGYIQAKAEMMSVLDDKGILIINSDDENSKKINLEGFNGRIVYFGIRNPCDFQASNIQYGENGMEFSLTLNHMKYKMFVPGYGEHQVYNALAALAAVHELGVGMKEAAELLLSFENLKGHLKLVNGIEQCTVIDDTWNSNPTSLRAAFKVLNDIAHGRKTVAIIGYMKALGNSTLEYHRVVGDMIAELGVDILITVGSIAEEVGKAACEKGLKGEIHASLNINDVLEFLKGVLDENTIVLVKCDMGNDSFAELITSLKV
jgi:UDP-N-acetylmuramoyl-tripeptide--D-alanyl-D-alanine ligase